MKFLADMDCPYVGRILGELGFDSESMYDVRRRARLNGDGMQRMYKDNAIAKYAAKEGRIIITRDWGFYYRLVKINQPAFLIRFDRGQLISKFEHALIVIAHYYPEMFRMWLLSGKYSFGKDLKYGGSWDNIKSKYTKNKIDQITNFDSLGYVQNT